MSNDSPRKVLFGLGGIPRVLPVCEHLAGNEKFIAKALTLQAQLEYSFDITCDLEDGSPVGDEESFLETIISVLKQDNARARLGVRVHDFQHPLFEREVESLVAQVGADIAYITVPKVSGIDEARKSLLMVNKYRGQVGITRTIPVHFLIETHGALRDAAQIAALPEVEAIDFGLMDFISEHQGAIPASGMRSPLQFEHALLYRARAEIAAAALGSGKVATHNVCVALESPTMARDDARRARQEFGFQRMWSIHPAQIEPILEGMGETFGEIEKAKEIIQRAMAEKWGPISFKNQLHDRASYRYYWLLLERARVAGMKLGAGIEELFD